jgi:hypothetical protein
MIDLREFVLRHGRAFSLGLRFGDRPLPSRLSSALLLLHLLGLLAVVRLTHQALWLAWVPILLIQPLVVSVRLKRPYLLAESLAPLSIAYGVLGLRLLVAIVARSQGLTSGPLTLPVPWGAVLNLNVAIGLSGLWACMAQADPASQAFGKYLHPATLVGIVLAAVSLAWAAVTYLTIRTMGVTASDPYAYVQMAVDLAQHGTPLHTFSLVPRVAEWGLPTWPVVPVGYNPPDVATGTAPTVWAPGYPALLAVAYWIGGENGLYVLAPWFGLAALVAVWALCLEVSLIWPSHQRFLAAGIAVFVLATSYEQVDRLAVPMADIPAQLFTILTIYFALRAIRGRTLLFAGMTGLCLGIAFAIRYTQVLLAFSVLLVWILVHHQPRPGWWPKFPLALAGFGLCAWLVAAPVLGYHQMAFGGPFRFGWSELELFGPQFIPRTLARMTGGFLRPKEFLYVAPLLIWGMIQLWRSARPAAVALLAWLIVIGLFHLNYAALRIRDLLSVFPALSLWAGLGMADALSQIGRLGRPNWRRGVRVLAFVLIIVLLYARARVTLWLPTYAQDFNTFGYLRAEQRAAFDRLASLTPSEAIVAASLNGGSITLYAERDIVRPAYWSSDEWLRFVDRALNDGRRIYLLVDGVEMQKPMQLVQSRYQLAQVSSLSVPYFYPTGNSQNQSVPLYEVLRREP